MQRITLIGNVGNDPEIREVGNDSKVVAFSVAVSETYKTQTGEKKTTTEWFRCEAWNKPMNLAGVVEQYVKKGHQIYVEGKIKTDTYTDKDGVEKTSMKVRVSSIELLSNKREEGGNPQTQSPTSTPVPEIPAEGDNQDLPF